MVRKQLVLLEDDLGGGQAVETLRFALDGAHYEIDVNAENAQRLRDALEAFIAHARRTDLRSDRAPDITPVRSPARIDKEQLDAMRRWARANGYEVADRGRISPEILAAYHELR